MIAGLYPAVWAVAQIWTGHWSDRAGRKPLIVAGMLLQAAALLLLAGSDARIGVAVVSAVALGAGTALVYPTLIAAISDAVSPGRAALDGRRLSLLARYGIRSRWLGRRLAADAIDYSGAIAIVAGLSAASGLWVAFDMPSRQSDQRRVFSADEPASV